MFKHLLDKVTLITLLTLFSIQFTSCDSGSDQPDITDEEELPPPIERRELELSAEARKAANSLQQFYVDFTMDAIAFSDSKNNSKSKNVIVSPLSAAVLLGMLANGCPDNHLEEICEYLGGINLEGLNDFIKQVMEQLPSSDNQSKFTLANGVWVNNNYHLNPTYSSLIENDYKAEISYENFSNTKSLTNTINSWGNSKTNGLIPQSIDNVNGSSVAVWLNSLFYKGRWANKDYFPKENSETAIFHGLSGNRKVNMMNSP